MEGDAPPERGLKSPVNTTLPPESGGAGTESNTFNDTPGNTTHGTLHHQIAAQPAVPPRHIRLTAATQQPTRYNRRARSRGGGTIP
eukprot:4421766-Prymnesium_polylepis.1